MRKLFKKLFHIHENVSSLPFKMHLLNFQGSTFYILVPNNVFQCFRSLLTALSLINV